MRCWRGCFRFSLRCRRSGCLSLNFSGRRCRSRRLGLCFCRARSRRRCLSPSFRCARRRSLSFGFRSRRGGSRRFRFSFRDCWSGCFRLNFRCGRSRRRSLCFGLSCCWGRRGRWCSRCRNFRLGLSRAWCRTRCCGSNHCLTWSRGLRFRLCRAWCRNRRSYIPKANHFTSRRVGSNRRRKILRRSVNIYGIPRLGVRRYINNFGIPIWANHQRRALRGVCGKNCSGGRSSNGSRRRWGLGRWFFPCAAVHGLVKCLLIRRQILCWRCCCQCRG